MFTTEQIKAASQKEAAAMIRANMAENEKWLVRGLLAIYSRQTADEQVSAATRHDNGVGFSAFDADILSSYAQQVQRWEAQPASQRQYAAPLSPRQKEVAVRKMSRYARQLATIVQEA
jgi:hypothetical protein